MNVSRFARQCVIVTGSGSGIGRGIALRFAQEGANIVSVDIDANAARRVAAEARGLGVESMEISGDATMLEVVNGTIAAALKRFGKIDILVNNVGRILARPLMSMKEGDWEMLMDTNAKTVYLWSREIAKTMVERGIGCIVNIASDAGKVGDADSGAYVASKHAVIGLTKTLALELAKYRVRVNAVCPGCIDTPLFEQFHTKLAESKGKTYEEARSSLIASIPLGRLGTPEDVAGVVAFLASPDASYMTGQSINVTGGLLMS